MDDKSLSSFQSLHMVYESEEAHKIIEDMMEEQIISTEEANLKTRAIVSSLQPLRQVGESPE